MGERIQIQLGQPNVIKAYNKGMRRVDMMDRLLESYRPRTTMKKWVLLSFCKHIKCDCYSPSSCSVITSTVK